MTTYRITGYQYGWVVNRVRILGPRSKNPGAERLIPLTYHLTLEQAVRAARERVLRDLWSEGGIDPLEVPDAVSRLLPRLSAALEAATSRLSTDHHQEQFP